MTNVTHTVRNSMIDSTRVFRLDHDGLSWTESNRRNQWRYADTARVHLISYPGYGGLHLQCTLSDRSGKKMKIRSHHFASLGAFEDRSESYGALIRALMARLATEGQEVEFCQGSTGMRGVWITLFVLSIVVLVGYLFALIGGPGVTWGSVAPLAAIVAFLPVSWLMIGRSRAGTFDPKAPPPGLLGSS